MSDADCRFDSGLRLQKVKVAKTDRKEGRGSLPGSSELWGGKNTWDVFFPNDIKSTTVCDNVYLMVTEVEVVEGCVMGDGSGRS